MTILCTESPIGNQGQMSRSICINSLSVSSILGQGIQWMCGLTHCAQPILLVIPCKYWYNNQKGQEEFTQMCSDISQPQPLLVRLNIDSVKVGSWSVHGITILLMRVFMQLSWFLHGRRWGLFPSRKSSQC
jgi:hypothetical protein